MQVPDDDFNNFNKRNCDQKNLMQAPPQSKQIKIQGSSNLEVACDEKITVGALCPS